MDTAPDPALAESNVLRLRLEATLRVPAPAVEDRVALPVADTVYLRRCTTTLLQSGHTIASSKSSTTHQQGEAPYLSPETAVVLPALVSARLVVADKVIAASAVVGKAPPVNVDSVLAPMPADVTRIAVAAEAPEFTLTFTEPAVAPSPGAMDTEPPGQYRKQG
jgi:hypothetical protein